jgi:phosphoribosylglycinamide formyltransferase 2
LPEGHSSNVAFSNLEQALAEPNTAFRLFGKPSIKGRRRMGVALARGVTVEEARQKANAVAARVQVELE